MSILRKSVIPKMILLILVFITIPLLIAGIILSNSILNLLIENNQKKNLQLTEQIAKKIDNNNLQFIFSVSSIMNDNDIIPSVYKWNNSTNRLLKFELSRQIDRKLSYYFNYTTDLIGIYFIFRNNDYYFYRNPIPLEVSIIKNQPWYQEMRTRKEYVKVIGKIKNSRFTANQVNGEYSIAIAAMNDLPENTMTNEVELVLFSFRGDTYQKSSNLHLSEVGTIESLEPTRGQSELKKLKQYIIGLNPSKINVVYSLYIEIVYYVFNFLTGKDLGPDDIWDQEVNFYNKIHEYETIDEINQFLENIFLKIIFELKQKNKNIPIKLKKAREYIRAHYHENISLKSVAEYLNVSETYISRLFTKEMGESFINYVTNLRIEKAKELLKNSNLSINEISEMVGYYNQEHFSRIFKKHEGCSPNKYRY